MSFCTVSDRSEKAVRSFLSCPSMSKSTVMFRCQIKDLVLSQMFHVFAVSSRVTQTERQEVIVYLSYRFNLTLLKLISCCQTQIVSKISQPISQCDMQPLLHSLKLPIVQLKSCCCCCCCCKLPKNS